MDERMMQNIDFPNGEIKYQQNVEEMKKLVPLIKEEMKACPSENLIFSLIETIDFYSLKRSFKLKNNKSSGSERNPHALNKFKDSLLTNISCLDSFVVIPTSEEFKQKTASAIGSEFRSPKVFDINGDENDISLFSSEDSVIFIYNNERDIELFVNKTRNLGRPCICLSVDMNFFEHKKWLKNKNFLLQYLTFYFTESDIPPSSTNLKLTTLPRVVLVNSNRAIIEDKCIKNIDSFFLQDILYPKNKENDNSLEDQRQYDNFIMLENDNKKKVIKSINQYLKNAGLIDVHFYVKTKIDFDKNGRKKTKCKPAFYGDAKREEINIVDNLIAVLNSQDLFCDVQNKVIVV